MWSLSQRRRVQLNKNLDLKEPVDLSVNIIDNPAQIFGLIPEVVIVHVHN